MRKVGVICSYCGKIYYREQGRVNEAKKFGWKMYCSSKCLRLAKDKRVLLECCNSSCKKNFKRNPKDVPESGRYYCSQSCAATINNRLRSLKRPKKICANPDCSKFIPWGNKYCSSKCATDVRKISRGKQKRRVLTKIKTFVGENGRIPLKKEMWGIYKPSRRIFGTWNKAIKAAGFEPNPLKFAKKHTAFDGHKCDSFAEFVIDNWLYQNNIPHQVHVSYPNSSMSSDFVVNGTWLEFVGLEGEVKKYTELLKKKRNLTKKLGLKVIEIYPRDLFPKNRLDRILKPLFLKNSSRSYYLG
jgi:predicted nucleic acid-binding Zn ribbon protein